MVHWLGLCAPNAGGPSSTKTWHNQNNNNKKIVFKGHFPWHCTRAPGIRRKPDISEGKSMEKQGKITKPALLKGFSSGLWSWEDRKAELMFETTAESVSRRMNSINCRRQEELLGDLSAGFGSFCCTKR